MIEVEFIGGPFDGHKELLDSGHPAEELAWIVCEDAFRLLAGKEHRADGSITSVALYDVEVGSGACRYRFAGAVSVNELTHFARER